MALETDSGAEKTFHLAACYVGRIDRKLLLQSALDSLTLSRAHARSEESAPVLRVVVRLAALSHSVGTAFSSAAAGLAAVPGWALLRLAELLQAARRRLGRETRRRGASGGGWRSRRRRAAAFSGAPPQERIAFGALLPSKPAAQDAGAPASTAASGSSPPVPPPPKLDEASDEEVIVYLRRGTLRLVGSCSSVLRGRVPRLCNLTLELWSSRLKTLRTHREAVSRERDAFEILAGCDKGAWKHLVAAKVLLFQADEAITEAIADALTCQRAQRDLLAAAEDAAVAILAGADAAAPVYRRWEETIRIKGAVGA